MAQSLVPVRAKVDLFPSALCVRLTWIGLWCRGQVGTELLGSQRGIKDKPPRLPECCSRFILVTICIQTIKVFTLPDIKPSYTVMMFALGTVRKKWKITSQGRKMMLLNCLFCVANSPSCPIYYHIRQREVMSFTSERIETAQLRAWKLIHDTYDRWIIKILGD